MTVKPATKIINQDQDLKVPPSSMDAVDMDRRFSEKMKKVAFTQEEAEESGGSSTEEVESPKSVARFARKKAAGRRFVQHNQILRVKEEDMFFAAEDIGKTTLTTKEPRETTAAAADRYLKRRVDVDVLVFSRPILPCSPLSGKTDSTVGAALR